MIDSSQRHPGQASDVQALVSAIASQDALTVPVRPAEISNVSLNGAHSDFRRRDPFRFLLHQGHQAGSSAQATALTVALLDRTGALDTNFNGTGQPINPHYRGRYWPGSRAPTFGTNGGTATDLDMVYGTVGSGAAQFVDYPITNGVPDLTNPTVTQTGTFSVPTDFASMQGYTFDSCGHILVNGDTTSNEETLTEIGGPPRSTTAAATATPDLVGCYSAHTGCP